MDRRLTRIYLNDHLAAMAVVEKLAERCRASNRASPLGAWLAEFEREQRAGLRTLELVMKRLRLLRSRWKVTAASLGQRLGRLKPNGRLRAYSPLSRVLELEFLLLGVEWNRAVLRSLEHVGDPRLEEFDLGGLLRRSAEQIAELERFRLEAVSTALAGGREAS